MKKGRLFILICAMLICLASVGCGVKENVSEIEEDSEDETEVKSNITKPYVSNITKPYVIVKYSETEIVVFSGITCSFSLDVSIRDGDFESDNTYKDFQISEGETITLTIEDLAPDFFSDKAIIEDADYNYSVWDYFPSNLDDYKWSDANILLKYSDKKVIVYSDKTCFFDLRIRTKDSDFESSNYYRGIEISEGETLELTLEDLAPGFFSDDTLISYCSEDIDPYLYAEK